MARDWSAEYPQNSWYVNRYFCDLEAVGRAPQPSEGERLEKSGNIPGNGGLFARPQWLRDVQARLVVPNFG